MPGRIPLPFQVLGKKRVEQVTQWLPTATAYGVTAGSALLYFTDWKLILQYLPFYNGKFKAEED